MVILAQCEHLSIYKAAFDLLVYFEKIAKNFSRYNKYTHVTTLRELSWEILMLIVRANNTYNKRTMLGVPALFLLNREGIILEKTAMVNDVLKNLETR